MLQRVLLGQRCQLLPADVRLEAELVGYVLDRPLDGILADGKVAALLVAIPTAGLLVPVVV